MTRIFAALAALALVLTACSSSGSGVPSADSAAFCTTLAQYTQSLTDFKQLPADATVADYQAAATDVKVQLAALTAASGDYVGAQLQELQTAQDDLVAATEGLTADSTPAQWQAATSSALDDVIAAAAGLELAECNTTPTPSAG